MGVGQSTQQQQQPQPILDLSVTKTINNTIEPRFSVSQKEGYAPLTVKFTDTSFAKSQTIATDSSGGRNETNITFQSGEFIDGPMSGKGRWYPDSWEWDLGDGNRVLNKIEFDYTYEKPGTYMVSLITRKNGFETKGIMKVFIQVKEQPKPVAVATSTSLPSVAVATSTSLPVYGDKEQQGFCQMMKQPKFYNMMRSCVIPKVTVEGEQIEGFSENLSYRNYIFLLLFLIIVILCGYYCYKKY